jgi:membrane dipeptidase
MTIDASLHRRALLQWAAGMGLGSLAGAGFAQAVPAIADMHSHLGLFARQRTPADLATEMRAHGVSVVAWKLVADLLWLGSNNNGVYQKSTPAAGELAAYFDKTLKEMMAYAQQTGLKVIRSAADLDTASAAAPALLIACEGADFLEGKVEGVASAAKQGLRVLQLVHYIRNPVGDFQTESPIHGGLTALGKATITACEENGVLVDLAHCSAAAVDQALDVARKPVIWSHGWVQGDGGSHRDPYGYLKRRLSNAQAKKIADKGGVVGLWGFGLSRPDSGWTAVKNDSTGYARELAKLVRLIGADHVGIGTDLAGVGDNWSVNDYGNVRSTMQKLESEKLSPAEIEKVAGGNFLRVLRQSLP